jgi:glycosyltransferase involved in cell wall biosynthesis
VTFLGWRSNEDIRELYRHATATLLPGVEDFGMVPVEAQACGCPVVALGTGGAAETVVDGATGVLVFDSSAEAFADGLSRVRELAVAAAPLREHALQFSRERFLTGFQAAVSAATGEDEP